MTKILNVLEGLSKYSKREISPTELPTQGLFYPEDMTIHFKKITIRDIEDFILFEHDSVSIHDCMNSVKYLLRKYLQFNNDNTFEDICYVDLIYLFWKMVEHSNGYENYLDYIVDNDFKQIPYSKEYFKYFDFTPYMDKYDPVKRVFTFNGYMYSPYTVSFIEALETYIDSKNNLYGDVLNGGDNTYVLGVYFSKFFKNLDNARLDMLFGAFADMDLKTTKKISKIITNFSDLSTYKFTNDGWVIEPTDTISVTEIFKWT